MNVHMQFVCYHFSLLAEVAKAVAGISDAEVNRSLCSMGMYIIIHEDFIRFFSFFFIANVKQV